MTTINILKKNNIAFRNIEIREELGLWLETEDMELEDGEIKRYNKRVYMGYENKNLKFYYPDEILDMNNIRKEQLEKNIITIYKNNFKFLEIN